MASSRLREHGSRLPVSWDRGGTITEGARAEGCRLQVAERPRGMGEEDRVASMGSKYSLHD